MYHGPFVHESLVSVPERHLYCCHYDHCLSTALMVGWPSWCCGKCTNYIEISAEQQVSDMYGLLRLLGEIHHPSGARKRRTEG
jgi:hypothetical protein